MLFKAVFLFIAVSAVIAVLLVAYSCSSTPKQPERATEPLWSLPVSAEQSAGIIASNGTLYLLGSMTGARDRVIAIQSDTGRLLWISNIHARQHLRLCGETLETHDAEEKLIRLDRATGRPVTTKMPPDCAAQLTTFPVALDSRSIVPLKSIAGTVQEDRWQGGDRTFTAKRTKSYAPLVLTDELMVARRYYEKFRFPVPIPHSEFSVVDRVTGQVLWSSGPDAPMNPAVTPNRIYLAANGAVHAFALSPHRQAPAPVRMYQAIEKGDLQALQQAIADGEASHAYDVKGRNVLTAAASVDNVPAIQFLLDRGVASINSTDAVGRTALVTAAGNKAGKAVEALLQRGADRNLTDITGESALIAALKAGAADIARTLLNAGADPNLCRSIAGVEAEDGAALHAAIAKAQLPMVPVLLEHGAKADMPDREKAQTPLHLAAAFADASTVALLLDHGAPLDPRNRDGLTPLLIAADRQAREIVDLLVKRGADKSAKNKDGFSYASLLRPIEPPQPLPPPVSAPAPASASGGQLQIGDRVAFLSEQDRFADDAEIIAAGNMFHVQFEDRSQQHQDWFSGELLRPAGSSYWPSANYEAHLGESVSVFLGAPTSRSLSHPFQAEVREIAPGWKMKREFVRGRGSEELWLPSTRIYRLASSALPKNGDSVLVRRWGSPPYPATVVSAPERPGESITVLADGYSDSARTRVEVKDIFHQDLPLTIETVKPGMVPYLDYLNRALVMEIKNGQCRVRQINPPDDVWVTPDHLRLLQ